MSHVSTPAEIRILPEQLANQIAAGEVVERPASVIKELIENSLDAQATQIDVEIEEGGIKKILVRDNGCGIPQAQLALALCRHATSKIETATDLQAIDSLGFRGEALASIGSVSRLQLISRLADAPHAWCLSSRNGVDNHIEPIAHPVGTSLEVCDLFYNTPARRKFLRAERTEFRHLDEIFRRMALGHFDVGFQLKHNRRVVHQLRPAVDPSSLQRRIQQVFGKSFVQQSTSLDIQASGLRLWGWLSQPDYLRSQADQQYFYVNGRIIRDRIINHAIRQAYETRLYPGRQAAYVLHLELDESLVDVNVHPTKHEVRFRESRLVHDFIHKVVSDALSETNSSISTPMPRQHSHTTPVFSISGSPPQSRISEGTTDYRVLTQTHRVAQRETPFGIWLGEIQNRFWLFQNAHALVLLDLPKAREAVFQQKLQEATTPLQQQPILIPINLSLTTEQIVLLEKVQDPLRDWGIDVRVGGPNLAMVYHMPVMLRGVDVEKLLRGLLELWVSSTAGEQVPNQLAHLAAMHFRYDSNIDNMMPWLEAVVKLPSSIKSVWRSISSERLAELIEHG